MKRWALWGMVCAGVLAGCATAPVHYRFAPTPEAKGVRIALITPARRMQGIAFWRVSERSGWMRILHPASGRSLELRWEGERVWWRAPEGWRLLDEAARARLGLTLSPSDLARFLLAKPEGAVADPRGWRWRGAQVAARWDARHGILEIEQLSAHQRVRIWLR